MNQSLRESSVVILGAGFSVAATDGKLPLMRTFFDQLQSQDFPLLHEFVSEVIGDPADANVESVLLTLDQIRTSPMEVLEGWADRWKTNATEINYQLATYTLNRLKPCLSIAEDNWAANLLYDYNPNSVVVSMNYDNIAEKILSCREGLVHGDVDPTCHHCKMRRLTFKGCSCSGKQEILDEDWKGSLIKPHGSIAWKRCLNPKCCSFQCMVADAHCMPFEPCQCPACFEACAPVLVMPTMSKNLGDTPEIGVMWKAARKAVADAESILLFGFSVPTSDELLLRMIRSAILSNRKLRRVASIDLDPVAVMERFQRCVPSDLAVEVEHFKVVPGQVPEWLT